MNYSKEDLIYLSGFLDGEGCFWLYRNKIGISCTNTYKPIIDWMKETFGGTIHKAKPRKANHRNCYTWCLVANQAKDLIAELFPYLREKQNQALLLFAYQSLPKVKGCRQGVPPELKAERERLVEIFKGMKHVP